MDSINKYRCRCSDQTPVRSRTWQITDVLVNDDTELALKKVKKQEDIVMLVSESIAYGPYIITEHNPARILGKAVEVVFDLQKL